MRPIIDPEEDYLTIVAAEQKLAASEAKRKKELEEAHANLKGKSFIYKTESWISYLFSRIALAKALESARISSTRPDSVPSAEVHASALNKCDSNKFSLMKAISDMESEIGSKEAELAALKEEARKLEEYDPAAEHEKELDGSV
jgi:kinetochore protein Spc24